MTRRYNVPTGVPLPEPSEVDAGFWRAAAEGRLDVQRCAECGRHRYPPTVSCYSCRSTASTWDTLPGTGTVMTYVWLPDRLNEEENRSYNVAVVQLDGAAGEPVRMVSNVVDAWSTSELSVGDRVRLECVPVPGGWLPCFRRATGSTA